MPKSKNEHLALARRLGMPEQKLQVYLDEEKQKGAYVDALGNIYVKDEVLQALDSPEVITAVKQFILQQFSKEHAEETQYYNTAQVCRMLKVSRKTLQKYRDNGYIGFVKAPGSRKYLYTKEHVEQFINSHKNG